jgi:hypothetical protein
MADNERSIRDILRGLEVRQSEIIGCLVEAGLWKRPLDPRHQAARPSQAAGHLPDASGSPEGSGPRGPHETAGGSEGGGSDRPRKDPVVRADPPRWTGQRFKGRRYSACPEDYLRALHAFLLWCADQAAITGEVTSDGRPRAPFVLADAKLANEWMIFNGRRADERRTGPGPNGGYDDRGQP